MIVGVERFVDYSFFCDILGQSIRESGWQLEKEVILVEQIYIR